MQSILAGRSLEQWQKTHPLINDLTALREVSWFNPHTVPFAQVHAKLPLNADDIAESAARLMRFAPYIAHAFPHTEKHNGRIESPLRAIPAMQQALRTQYNSACDGTLLLKCDNALPISGSIKARGGVYEVLAHAENLAVTAGMLSLTDDYAKLAAPAFREFFSQYTLVVGSTGNLGLSIGIMGTKLGFNVTVHMSSDAKQWKKETLRSKGATVVEHTADYSRAVAEGRRQADADPASYFIDDENSQTLFLGYALAAAHLQTQLADMHITVDNEHPLFVYLPCGVGGGPGGITFGLKHIFHDAVHCVFAEPTHSPAMLLGLYTGLHDDIAVHDIGLDNRTAADGLAVGRPSGFVGKNMHPLIDGVYTVSDENMYRMLTLLKDTENISLEPSALAGMAGPLWVQHARNSLEQHFTANTLSKATHIVWATGGSMVPETEMAQYYATGKALLSR